MATSGPPPIIPNPRPARTIGLLNILVGLALLPCTCLVGYVSFQPNPFERIETDPHKLGFQDPWLDGWMAVDVGTAFVLNAALLVSGFGLMRLAPWGRKLALWTCSLKIARLLVLSAVYMIWLTPVIARKTAEAAIAEGEGVSGPGGQVASPTLRETTQFFGVLYMAFDLGYAVFGPIYPAIVLWVLTRPGVRAAFVVKAPGVEDLPSPPGRGQGEGATERPPDAPGGPA
jgi:hypothetical protein